MAKHGDPKLLYLLAEITRCPKAQSVNIYDRCAVRFERLAMNDRTGTTGIFLSVPTRLRSYAASSMRLRNSTQKKGAGYIRS
jgi:hypothetical protein